MGKDNFLLVAEIGGGDDLEEAYLSLEGRNLSAALEVGETRQALRDVAGGRAAPSTFFLRWPREDAVPPSDHSEKAPERISDLPAAGSHRNLGSAFVLPSTTTTTSGSTPGASPWSTRA